MVSNTIIIGLALFELGKFFSRHSLWSQFFGLCDLGVQKRNAWLMWVKGLLDIVSTYKSTYFEQR